MWISDVFKSLKAPRHQLAWLIAVAADAVQIVALPLFAEGVLSPFDTVLDIAVAVGLIRLLGWHWAFVPSFLGELVPGAAELVPALDLFPTWTAAVIFVTRQQVRAQEPEILPPQNREQVTGNR